MDLEDFNRDVATPILQKANADMTRLRAENERLTSDLAVTTGQLRRAREIYGEQTERIVDMESQLAALRRPVEQSAEVAEILERMDVGNGLWSDVPKLRAALDSAQREIEGLQTVAVQLEEVCRIKDQQIARLSSPPQERAEIAERQRIRRSVDGWDRTGALADLDTLLQDLARASNALDDRVRMLGIVQDSLSERNRENVELRAKCERLEKESINADGDLQLRDERIERLQGALRKIRRWEMPETGRTWDDGSPMSYFAVWGSNGERDVILGIAAEALAASQHTAHSDAALDKPPRAQEEVWRCFHCGEVCSSQVDARNHFGSTEASEPACLIKVAGEFALLSALRNAEDQLQRYRSEDSDVLRAMYSMQSDHQQALRREEERGYAKGVADMKAAGWVVENGKTNEARRYRYFDETGCVGWTADHMQALRFARRQDAEQFSANDDEAWAIVEHTWSIQQHTAGSGDGVAGD